MSVMERRLQILIDQERYDRVAREAERSGRSVAAVIREAIDVCFGDDLDLERDRRSQAAARLLAMTEDPLPGDWESPAELKAAWHAQLDEKLARP